MAQVCLRDSSCCLLSVGLSCIHSPDSRCSCSTLIFFTYCKSRPRRTTITVVLGLICKDGAATLIFKSLSFLLLFWGVQRVCIHITYKELCLSMNDSLLNNKKKKNSTTSKEFLKCVFTPKLFFYMWKRYSQLCLSRICLDWRDSFDSEKIRLMKG